MEKLYRFADVGIEEVPARREIAPGRVPATARLLPHDVHAFIARASSSTGASLPTDVRARFEGSLGGDLSAVRVHTGADSAAAARAVGALAYTVGNDIHFGEGRYAPTDPFGLHLLAHEVAHTRQQAGAAPVRQHKLEMSSPGDAAEREADHAADAMIAGAPFAIAVAGSGLARTEDGAAAPDDKAADPKELSELRKKLLQEFQEMDNKVVGDPEFDPVQTNGQWVFDHKLPEAIQMLGSQATFGAIKPPAIFTTCIQTQGTLLTRAFTACKQKAKPSKYGPSYYAAMTRNDPDEWHPAQVGVADRPRPGDVLVLAGRGGDVENAGRQQQGAEADTAQRAADDAKADANVAKYTQAEADARKALDDLNAVDADPKATANQHKLALIHATNAINLAHTFLTNSLAQKANTSKALGAARDREAKADAKMDAARPKAQHDDKRFFEFRHTCFLAGEIVKDQPPGKETWPVFGGGASVAARGGQQGAEHGTLVYDPATNELSDPSNKAQPAWFQGWCNVDAMGTADTGAKK